jgi:hypothetical protein
MKFYMHVSKEDQLIERREYSTATLCTDKMLIAEEYYANKDEIVTIKMIDERGAFIAQLVVPDDLITKRHEDATRSMFIQSAMELLKYPRDRAERAWFKLFNPDLR